MPYRPWCGYNMAHSLSLLAFHILSHDVARTILQVLEQTAALRDSVHIWPNNKVYYQISSSFSEQAKKHIKAALKTWERETCVKFKLWMEESPNVLKITNNNGGCFIRTVGYSIASNSTSGNTINLEENAGCTKTKEVLHQVGHALGLFHEQSRPDRDQYITINKQNINPKLWSNFKKRSSGEVTSFGREYDYASIMHFQLNVFSKNEGNTMAVKDKDLLRKQGMKEAQIGRVETLSPLDILGMNELYHCYG